MRDTVRWQASCNPFLVPGAGGAMDEAREIAEQLRTAEMELQLAQRAYDGSEQARRRYARAVLEMEEAQRRALKFVRENQARARS
jgi:lactam utilization protein B